ncbi:MAG: YafY family protein [Coriobacteriia bacterium]
MIPAVERLINLALFIAESPVPVTVTEARDQVEGYPPGQDEAAFLRMFERDKKALRAAGVILRTVETPEGTAYELDREATFQSPVTLSEDDRALLFAACVAALEDPVFPFKDALVSSLSKLSGPAGLSGRPLPAAAPTSGDASVVQTLARACMSRKKVSFAYTNHKGERTTRTVRPYGLFMRAGRWYLVAYDELKSDVRVFFTKRMSDVQVETARPSTPDYDIPSDFDPEQYRRLPFEYGDEKEFEAVLLIEKDHTWRAQSLTEGRGVLTQTRDGLEWRITCRNPRRLARWVVENGPGLTVVGPPDVTEAVRSGLEEVVRSHE